MADIPSNLEKMNNLEISDNGVHSEALMTKVGANINALIDFFGGTEFSTAGADTYDVPDGVNRLLVVACGGGGGGAGGGAKIPSGSLVDAAAGGNGGNGAIINTRIINVQPLESLALNVGAGGGGGAGGQTGGPNNPPNSGADGGDTTITSVLDTYTFKGGFGGKRQQTTSGGAIVYDPQVRRFLNPYISAVGGNAGNITIGATSQRGEDSTHASGGDFGTTNGTSYIGGAGGGASRGGGGVGGNAAVSAVAQGSAGGNGGVGAGGGGGGGAHGNTGSGQIGGSGGTGGNGFILIIPLTYNV